jgi:hypothetical protein
MEEDDLQVAANINLSRIISPTQKVDISLEQIETFENPKGEIGIPKSVPNILMEPDRNFAMNIKIPFPVENRLPKDYALLLTQSTKLISKPLPELDIQQDFKPLHDATKDAFYKLINKTVCDEDWEFREE